MKEFSKILSIILSLVLMLVTLPISGLFSASATADWDYYTIRDYTGDNSPSINDSTIFDGLNDSRVPGREFVSQYTPDGTKWSLKFSMPKNRLSTIYFKNISDMTYGPSANGSLGMRMWVANPSDNVVCLHWQFVNNSGSRTANIQNNRAYYLQTKGNSKVYGLTTRTSMQSSAVLEIPAGFEGWLYIPYAATNFGNANTEDGIFTKVRLVFPYADLGRDVELYASRIDYYSDSAFTAASTTDFTFDTMVPYTDVNSTDISTNIMVPQPTGSVELDSTVHEGQSGQSIKVTFDTNNDSSRVRFRMFNLCAALANDSADGISFWVKNTQNTDIKISIMTYQGNSNIAYRAPYYIKPDGGDAYTAYTASSPTLLDNGGRVSVVIPANFAGRVYLPYSLSDYLKQGLMDFHVCETDGISTIVFNFDNFKNYNFEEIGTLITTTFDYVSDISTVMNNYNNPVTGKDQLSTDSRYTDGGTGQSIKMTLKAGETWRHDFKNLAPSSDIATYVAGDGYRFWISNPNDFSVKMRTDFYDFQYALVGRNYYLIDDNGFGSAYSFQGFYPGDANRGCIVIPASFSGYVYVPGNSIYNTANRPVTNSTAWQFYPIIFDVEQDGYLYIDSYGIYTGLPEFKTRKVASVFSDGVLFQQNKPINIWGFDSEGTSVTAKIYKDGTVDPLQTLNTTADSNGRFDFSFTERTGGYDTYHIEITDTYGTVAVINDVLIGELWLSSGQSNMEFIVGTTADNDQIFAAANDTNLRVFINPNRTSQTELDDASNSYWICGTDTREISQYTSAVALVFAYNLKEKLDVPIGIINTAVGGSRIYEWLGHDATLNNPTVNGYVSAFVNSDGNQLWSRCYNARIAPLAGLNIAGTIWYQGESDNYRYQYYAAQLDLLKESLGELFGFENDSMPFIYTQVAPDVYNEAASDVFRLGYLAEAMVDAFLANEDNNTAMLTVYDVPLNYGNEGEIHPNVKIPVGERFAQSAINLCYGGTGETSAPIYSSKEIKGDTVYVNFTHVGTGLSCTGDEIHGFTIAGSDGVYVNARAKIIDSDTVMVWNDYVKNPVNVTYAFASMNQASNLVNSVGIPASPFRTNRDAETYTTIEEWMFAEADAWERYGTKESGIKPSWTVTTASGTASYNYSSSVKTEGSNSLAVSYDGTDTVTTTPVINTYRGKEFDLSKYSSIKLDVKANAGATVQLVVDGADYGSQVTLDNDGFNTVVISLENAIATKASLAFKVSGLTSTVFYIDNISVGTGAKAAVFGDVNDDGGIDGEDINVLRKHLLELETDINMVKADVNCDENIDICDLIRAKKYAFIYN